MKLVRAAVLAAWSYLGITSSLLAQIEQHEIFVEPAARNAAIVYWQAFGAITPELSKAVSNIEWNDGFTKSAMTDSFHAAAVIDSANAVNLISQAAKMSKCNFECRWEDGFMTLLPHLGHMRGCARLMRLEARKRAIAGDLDGAVSSVIDIRRIATHASMEPIAISKLVALAINALACDEAKKLAQSGLLTAPQRDALIAELKSTTMHDVFRISEFFIGERSWIVANADSAWIRKNILPAIDDATRRTQLAELTDEDLLKDLRKVDGAYNAMVSAWNDTDFESKLKEITSRVQAGDFGMLAQSLMPSLSNIKAAANKARDTVLDTINALENAKLRD